MNPLCLASGSSAKGNGASASAGAEAMLNCRKRAGFTLIELLVVIAIIAILAAILLPVLAHAKLKATQAYCVNNQKELATAWIMYTGDNNESLPLAYTGQPSWNSIWPNTEDAGGFWGVNKGFPPFTGNNEGVALQNIQSCLMTNNLLYQYAGNVGTYHCPGDQRFTQPINTTGDIDWAYDSYAIPENVEPAEASQTGTSFSKMANIHRVADCMIFVEQADPRGYNEGTFEISVTMPSTQPISYTDIFSMYHGDVGTFSFADGHAEAHRWHDSHIIGDGVASVAYGSQLDQYSACPGSTAVLPQKGIDAAYIIQHCVDQGNE